jgi:hypothetical protein
MTLIGFVIVINILVFYIMILFYEF